MVECRAALMLIAMVDLETINQGHGGSLGWVKRIGVAARERLGKLDFGQAVLPSGRPWINATAEVFEEWWSRTLICAGYTRGSEQTVSYEETSMLFETKEVRPLSSSGPISSFNVFQNPRK